MTFLCANSSAVWRRVYLGTRIRIHFFFFFLLWLGLGLRNRESWLGPSHARVQAVSMSLKCMYFEMYSLMKTKNMTIAIKRIHWIFEINEGGKYI